MRDLITRRGYSILSSLFVFVGISIISGELIFATISMFLFSIFFVELLIFLFTISQLSRIKVIREISKKRLFVGDSISVKTILQNDGYRNIGIVKILDDIPDEFQQLGKINNYTLNLGPGEKSEFEYKLEAVQMGRMNLGKLSLYLFDKFGLFYKKRIIKENNFISVLPNVRIGRGNIESNIHLGSLSTSTKTDPLGSDFSGIREYSSGDDYRKIAWKYMAKSSIQEPKIKQFELEQKIDVNFVILNSKHMNDGDIGKRKLDRIVQTAITISSVVNNAGGKFQVIFSERNKPAVISGSVYELCNYLCQIKIDESLEPEKLINHALNYTQRSSILLIVVDSPFPEKIKIEDYTRRFNNKSLVNIFILDTASFITQNIIEKSSKHISELLDNERNHLQEQVNQIRQNNLTVDICTKDNIARKIVESFTTTQLLVE